MKNIGFVLGHLAALVAVTTACSDTNTMCGSAPGDTKDLTVTPDVACAVAQDPANAVGSSQVCSLACNGATQTAGARIYSFCELPSDYVLAVRASDAGAGGGGDAGASACPQVAGPIALHCGVDCTGRRTAGIDDLSLPARLDAGSYFAACAYLEEVSVHAFARLADELASHGAPASLVGAARNAEAEERHHTLLMSTLAARFGSTSQHPTCPTWAPRSLFEIALENAVEGCVRETFGAALAVLRARQATLPAVREALQTIAHDECNHAQLSWDVAAWALPRLTEEERAQVRASMKGAALALTSSDARLSPEARVACSVPPVEEQRRLVSLLELHVFRSAA